MEQLTQEMQWRNLEAAVVPAANKLLASIKRRIQLEGKGSNGTLLGTYSRRPGYYGKDRFVKKSAFKAKGKPGSQRNPNPRKTMFLENGYGELRSIQGRDSGKVNLTYSGDLMLSYRMLHERGRVILGLDSEKQMRKKEGLEKRYGKFLQATKDELGTYDKEVRETLRELTISAITGL